MRSRFVLAVLSVFLVTGIASAQDAEKQEAKKGKVTAHGLIADGATGAARAVARAGVWLVHQSPGDYARLTATGATGAAKGTAVAARTAGTQAKRSPGYAAKGLKWLVSRI